VVSAQAVDTQRAGLKRRVRDIANGARSFATGLRRRMNALDARAEESAYSGGGDDGNELLKGSPEAGVGSESIQVAEVLDSPCVLN
jgi:hypothetical protein